MRQLGVGAKPLVLPYELHLRLAINRRLQAHVDTNMPQLQRTAPNHEIGVPPPYDLQAVDGSDGNNEATGRSTSSGRRSRERNKAHDGVNNSELRGGAKSGVTTATGDAKGNASSPEPRGGGKSNTKGGGKATKAGNTIVDAVSPEPRGGGKGNAKGGGRRGDGKDNAKGDACAGKDSGKGDASSERRGGEKGDAKGDASSPEPRGGGKSNTKGGGSAAKAGNTIGDAVSPEPRGGGGKGAASSERRGGGKGDPKGGASSGGGARKADAKGAGQRGEKHSGGKDDVRGEGRVMAHLMCVRCQCIFASTYKGASPTCSRCK